MGWYTDNVRNGNHMALDPTDLSVIESGWWDNGQRTGDMKDDPILKNFKVWDIFLDYTKNRDINEK